MMKTLAGILGGLVIIGSGVLYDLGTLSPTAPKIMALYVGAAMAFGMLFLAVWRGRHLTFTPLDLALGATFAWASLSIAWSTDWRGGLYALAHIICFLAIFWAARYSPRDIVDKVVPAAVTISIAIILAMLAYGPAQLWGGFGNANFAAEYLMIAAPFAAWLAWKQKRFVMALPAAVVLLGAAYVLFAGYPSRMPFVGLLGALAMMVWFCRRYYYLLALVAGLGALAVLGATSLDQPIAASILSRMEIWFNAAILWSEKPMIGWGLGGFAHEYDRVQGMHIASFPSLFGNGTTILGRPAAYVGSAHNEIVQIAVELGMIGLVFAGACVWLLVKEVSGAVSQAPHMQTQTCRPFMIAVMAITGAASFVEFPIHNPATAMLFAVAAGIATRGPSPAWRVSLGRLYWRIPAAVICLALLVGTGVFAKKSYSASLKMQPFLLHTVLATNKHPAASLVKAAQANFDAYKEMPLHPYFRRQLMLSIGNLLVKHRGKVKINRETADLAYKVAMTAAPYTPAVMLNRIVYLMNTGSQLDAEIPRLLNILSTNGAVLPEYWTLDGWFAFYNLNLVRAESSLAKALAILRRRNYSETRIKNTTGPLASAIDKVRKQL